MPNLRINVPVSVSQVTLSRSCRCGSALTREHQPAQLRRVRPECDLPQTRVMKIAAAEHDSLSIRSPSRTADIEVLRSKPLRFLSGPQIVRERQQVEIGDVIRCGPA